MGESALEALRRTPLYEHHVRLKARIVEFAGWAMPLQYEGIVAEHRAVRSGCGIFDVSHMAEFWIEGPQALRTLDRLLCNDPKRLADCQGMYTPLCNERGGILDDLVVLRVWGERFLVVGNASRREVDGAWLRTHAHGCRVRDATEQTALVAVQGPLAAELLQPLVEADLGSVRYYHCVPETRVAGVRALVSRTGYTGEDGFEVFTPWEEAGRVWEALLEAGAVPCGLGARDTLRLEAGYLLYGQDMDEETTPWEAGLGWTVKLEGRTFIGREALWRQREEGVRRRLVGLEVRGRAIARPGAPILRDGTNVGVVTSGSWGPWVQKSIALGYVPPSLAQPGTQVQVEIRGRGVPAEVVKLPFYRRIPRTKSSAG